MPKDNKTVNVQDEYGQKTKMDEQKLEQIQKDKTKKVEKLEEGEYKVKVRMEG